MAKRDTLKPGELPNVFDTDAPPMHEATVILEGYVGVDEAKLTKEERAEVHARHALPNFYVAPKHEAPEQSHERHTAPRTAASAGTHTNSR